MATLTILGLEFCTPCEDTQQALQDGQRIEYQLVDDQQIDFLLVDPSGWLMGRPILSCTQAGWVFGPANTELTATPEEAIRNYLIILSDLWTKQAQHSLQRATQARREHDEAIRQHHEVKILLRAAEDLLG